MTPTEKAEAAKQLLNSPVMKSVFADVRENFVTKLESVPIGDTDTQHDITLILQLLKLLQNQLANYIQAGVVDKYRSRQDEFIERTREKLT